MIELQEEELSRRALTIIDQCGGVAPYAMAFYGLSIKYSAQRAVGAFQLYSRLIDNETEPSLLISTVQEAIGHSSALSRYFWPSPGGRESKEIKRLRKSRGEKLRKHYHLSDDSPLGSRELRNAWEHFDEKLDLFLLSNDAGYFFPMPIIGSHTLADDPVGKVFKLLDPDAECLVLLGEKYYFKPVQDEVEKVFSREK